MTAQGPGDPLDAALAIANAFEIRQIDYALGGALAYGLWGIPLATIDVDFNIFVEQTEIGQVTSALAELSIVVDMDRAIQQNAERGMFQVQFGHFRMRPDPPADGSPASRIGRIAANSAPRPRICPSIRPLSGQIHPEVAYLPMDLAANRKRRHGAIGTDLSRGPMRAAW